MWMLQYVKGGDNLVDMVIEGGDNTEMGLKDMDCWCCVGLSGPEWVAVVHAYAKKFHNFIT